MNSHNNRARVTPKPYRGKMIATKEATEDLPKYATGILPENAPLANPYVPFQREGDERYEAPKGLIRGTLFPGLDLPFMGMVNTKEKDTPLAELQALSFALVELSEYLDTHRKDEEALALFKKYSKLYESGMAEYERRYGPLMLCKAGIGDEYDWICDPWPWDYEQEKE